MRGNSRSEDEQWIEDRAAARALRFMAAILRRRLDRDPGADEDTLRAVQRDLELAANAAEDGIERVTTLLEYLEAGEDRKA